MLKTIIILNWIIIGVLALLVGAETFFPAQGGDAAGRGMGKAIYWLSVIVLGVLLVLNLLPYALSKYIAFGLIAVPFLWFQLAPRVQKIAAGISGRINAKPFYEDPERERIAQILFAGDVGKLKQLLQNPPPRLREPVYGHPLLRNAVEWALKFPDDKSEDRLECIRALLAAGVSLTDNDPEMDPIQIAAATAGNPEVLKILLEHGADPNAGGNDYSTGRPNAVPMIFEAVGTYYGARDCVRLLLEHGANPNAIKPRDGDLLAPSILMFAAERQRWDVCLMLIEKGADAHYKTPGGQSLKTFLELAEGDFSGDQYSTMEDFERVKKAAL